MKVCGFNLIFYSLTVVVLIVESHWTDRTTRTKKQFFPVEQNSTCWEKEKYEVVKDCEPCTGMYY